MHHLWVTAYNDKQEIHTMFRVTDIPHRGPRLVLAVAAPPSMEEWWSDALESHHNQVVGVALVLALHHQDCSNTHQVRKVSNTHNIAIGVN